MKPSPHRPLVSSRDRSADHLRCRKAAAALRVALAGLGVVLGGAQGIAYTDTTWTGAVNNTFLNQSNWTNGILTSSNNSTGSMATFSGALTANQPRLATNQGIYGIRLTTETGGWTISGASGVLLTVGAGGIRSTGQTSGTNTISVRTIDVNTNQTWSVGTGGTLVFDSVITNSNSAILTLGINGTDEGTFIFNGSSTRSSGTTFRSGTLLLGNDTALGVASSRLTVVGGGAGSFLGASGGARTLANNVTLDSGLTFVGTHQLTFTGSSFLNNGQTMTVNNGDKVVIDNANGIGGTGGFTVGNGTGTLVIAGGTNANTGTVVLDGKLQLGNAGTTGALNASSAVTLNGTGELSFDRTDAAFSVANVISGSGALRQKGTGTTTVSGNNSAFTGATTVAAGTLVVGHANALGGAGGGAVSVSTGATLRSSVGLTFSNNVTNRGTINSGGNAVIFAAGKTLEGAGVFNGGGSFTVNGTLTHGDSAGTTTIDSAAMTLGSASTTVWSLSALTDNGTGSAGADWSTFALQGTGSLSILSGATLQILLDGVAFDGSQAYWQTSHTYALFNSSVTGSFVLANNVFSDAHGTGTFAVSGNNLTYSFVASAIPEPSTFAFVVAAGFGAVFLRARRRASVIS